MVRPRRRGVKVRVTALNWLQAVVRKKDKEVCGLEYRNEQRLQAALREDGDFLAPERVSFPSETVGVRVAVEKGGAASLPEAPH